MPNGNLEALLPGCDVLAQAVASTSSALVILHPSLPEHCISYVNPSFTRLTGYAAEEVRGSTLERLLCEVADPQSAAGIWEAIRDHRSFSAKTSLRRKDGSAFWADLKLDPMNDEGPGRTGFVLLIADMTEDRAREEQHWRDRKTEAMVALAGDLGHDFGNIFSVLMGYAESLSARPDHPNVRRVIDGLLETSRRGADMTRQLLSFGERSLAKPSLVDVNRTVSHTEGLLRRILGGKTELKIIPFPGAAEVHVDSSLIEQAVLNLAARVRNSGNSEGTFFVQTSREVIVPMTDRTEVKEWIRISICDTSGAIIGRPLATMRPGASIEDRRRVAEAAGVSALYQAVYRNGGEVLIREVAPGGRSVDVYLPAAKPSPKAAGDSPVQVSAPENHRTILLVEDHERMRTIVTELLECRHYAVVPAASGPEALLIDASYQRPIDLILTDVSMPDMSGIELARQLRARRPDVRILFMTGYTVRSSAHLTPEPGRTGFLQKPFSPEELLTKVREVLET